MKKKIAALAALCAFMLSGCTDYGTDLPKKYSKFLEYTFNDEYEITLKAQETYEHYDSEADKTSTFGYRRWSIRYSDKNGVPHEMELYASHSEKTGHEQYDKLSDDVIMYASLMNEICDITSCELYNKLVRKYFDAGEWQGDDSYIYSTDDFKMQAITYNITPAVIDYESNLDLIEPALSPKTGIRLAECSLAEEASREDTMTLVRMYIYDSAKKQIYKEAMEQLIEEYTSYVGEPQNYHFDLVFCDTSGAGASFETLLDRGCFLGVQTVLDREEGRTPDLTVYEDYLIEKLGYERGTF